MIIDQISEMHSYIPTLPALKTVIEILASGKLETQTLGSYKTDDPRVRYNLFTYKTISHEAKEYEIHQKETDVQILIKGFERMDIASRKDLETTCPYDEAKDAFMAKGKKLLSYHAKNDTFAVFFPGEPHAPNLIEKESNQVVKVVFKILM